MVIFRKNEKKNKKSETRRAIEALQEFAISDFFYSEKSRRLGKRRTEEEIEAERKRVIEECKKILKEYEERIAREEQEK